MMSNIVRLLQICRQLSGNSSFINNEHIDYARSYLIAYASKCKKRLIAHSEGMSDLVTSPASSTTGSLVDVGF